MASLNKHEPYGEVIGHKFARYEQGGKYFDGRGLEIDLNTGKHKSGGRSNKSPSAESEAKRDNDNAGAAPSPTYAHKGAGYYTVRDAEGNIVLDGVRKEEAEKKIAELKAGDNEQLMSSLQDG